VTQFESDRWAPLPEPAILYMERAVLSLHTDKYAEGSAEVLKYADEHLSETSQAMGDYLAQQPPAPSVRAARRIVEHLVTHPALPSEVKLSLESTFNGLITSYKLDQAKKPQLRLDFVKANLEDTSVISVDDTA